MCTSSSPNHLHFPSVPGSSPIFSTLNPASPLLPVLSPSRPRFHDPLPPLRTSSCSAARTIDPQHRHNLQAPPAATCARSAAPHPKPPPNPSQLSQAASSHRATTPCASRRPPFTACTTTALSTNSAPVQTIASQVVFDIFCGPVHTPAASISSFIPSPRRPQDLPRRLSTSRLPRSPSAWCQLTRHGLCKDLPGVVDHGQAGSAMEPPE